MNTPVSRIPLGYQALIHRYQLEVPALRRVFVAVDRAVETRTTTAIGEETIELPRQRIADRESLAGQLTFAFKREELNLTVLAALFQQPEAIQGVQAWLAARPSSKYSRIAGHLATWLTGHAFDYRLPPGSPRVRLLDPQRYVVGPAHTDPKFGVISNLLGDRHFSPLVRRTERLDSLLAADLAAKVTTALQSIEPEVLARAVDYLYLSETRSTYSIEDEMPDHSRAVKFRRLLELAGEPGLLTEDQLCQWQNQVVDRRSAEASYRTGQNWLSRPGRFRNIADFIPPPAGQIPPMMDSIAGLASLGADGAIDPVIAATCASFGFVFVHPFWDGNGRLHRFLLHHVLRQAGFTPKEVVLPLSARMLQQLARYSALLKGYSRPRTDLLDYALDADSDTIMLRTPQPPWLYAYWDATEACEFMLECAQACVDEDLQVEITYLRAHDATVRQLEGWLDMRQSALNTLIDIVVQGRGTLSKAKRTHALFAHLTDDEVARVEAAVLEHFRVYLERIG
ncbi:MAG: Fic family protein [Burkholderiaceae bacterium]|nr:Fic family protein [Burkholderiaceae bacterium]